MRPIHLMRYGLPAAILIAGVVVLAVGYGAVATGAGVVLIGVAAIVFVVNVLARLRPQARQTGYERGVRSRRWLENRVRRLVRPSRDAAIDQTDAAVSARSLSCPTPTWLAQWAQQKKRPSAS